MTGNSSKLEIQLTFLAKQLELERTRREKLQEQVEEMATMLKSQNKQAVADLEHNKKTKLVREQNVKPVPGVDDPLHPVTGFVSIQ